MLYIGIDWSEQDYQVCILNPHGGLVSQLTLKPSPTSFAQLEAERAKLGTPAGDCAVAIETAHNLIVDFLLEHDYPVYIVSPQATKSYRNRPRISGAHTDASDAALLAGAMRTDRDQHRRWQPYTPLVQQLRVRVRLIETLHRAIQRQTNQLRAALVRTFPNALGVFSDLKAQIALQFLIAYPTAPEAQALSRAEFEAFLRGLGDTRPDQLVKRYARLTQAAPLPQPAVIDAYRETVWVLAQGLLPHVRAWKHAQHDLYRLFESHPDAALFASLPGAGELLAPSLLAKFGDQRERFPTAGSVQSLAGTCPVTEKSGKKKWIHFRTGCDKEFRRIAQNYALASLADATWANAFWSEIRPHCRSDSHATRILANRWLAIIWKMWQTRTEYDEQRHLAQRTVRHQPKVRTA